MLNNEKYDLNESYGCLLATAAQHMRLKLTKKFIESGFEISTEQWRIMVLLKSFEGTTQKNIAKMLNRSKVAVSKLTSSLEKKGLIERMPNPDDGRSYTLFLTDNGLAILPDLNEIAIKNRDKSSAGINKKEMKVLREILKKIIKNTAEY